MVSNGWQTLDSTRPAHPPAIKCCNGFTFLLLGALEEAVGVGDVAAAATGSEDDDSDMMDGVLVGKIMKRSDGQDTTTKFGTTDSTTTHQKNNKRKTKMHSHHPTCDM